MVEYNMIKECIFKLYKQNTIKSKEYLSQLLNTYYFFLIGKCSTDSKLFVEQSYILTKN